MKGKSAKSWRDQKRMKKIFTGKWKKGKNYTGNKKKREGWTKRRGQIAKSQRKKWYKGIEGKKNEEERDMKQRMMRTSIKKR